MKKLETQEVQETQEEPKRRRRGMKVINGEEYFTCGLAAKVLDVSKNTLLKFSRTGKLYSLKLGRMTCFKKEWLDVFVDQMTQKGSCYMEKRK
jgi:excisionase family DNA binding protein